MLASSHPLSEVEYGTCVSTEGIRGVLATILFMLIIPGRAEKAEFCSWRGRNRAGREKGDAYVCLLWSKCTLLMVLSDFFMNKSTGFCINLKSKLFYYNETLPWNKKVKISKQKNMTWIWNKELLVSVLVRKRRWISSQLDWIQPSSSIPRDKESWGQTENTLGTLFSHGLKLWQVPAQESGCLFR